MPGLEFSMNRINPDKLLNSKWTAVEPRKKQRHFIVTRLMRDDFDKVIACELEAVIDRQVHEMAWQALKDDACWRMGWK